MTDKQIIIDGVDVSECRHLAYPELDNPMCNGLYLGCQKNNCEYKKWKRKEQECERLKKQNEILLGQLVINDGEDVTVQISQSQFEEYNQLKAENEELKNFHINLVGVKECEIKELLQLKAEHKEVQKALDKLLIDNGRLKLENNNFKKMFEDEEVMLALNEVRTGERHLWFNKAEKLEKALQEIQPILEFYANSKIGEERADGTYIIELAGISMRGYGTDFLIFNPKPARQALQKISEVIDEN